MNPKVSGKMQGAVNSCQSEQGGTMPEGSGKSPQKVEGVQTHYTGHDSAPTKSASGHLMPGKGGKSY